jgi:hypothetical protein
MIRGVAPLALLLAILAPGCGAASHDSDSEAALDVLSDPSVPLPSKLSEVGIYPELDLERPSPRALPYRPRSELWSNGLSKQRLLVLPAGKRIHPERVLWQFPKGTLLFKTFSDERGPVETRVLRQVGAKFEYAVYQWEDEDAMLLDGRRNVPLEVRTGEGNTPHTIPSTLTCRQCHESSASQVLGLTALQGFDAELPELAEVFESAPELSDPLPASSTQTRAVLDYFVGNCVHCHNGSVGLASSFDLRPDVPALPRRASCSAP